MGSTKVDIFKKERDWFEVNLSDTESVKGLLKYRSQFDLLFGRDFNRLDISSSGFDLINQLEEVTCTYVWLDDIIKRTRWTQQQARIMQMVMEEYTTEEIAEVDGTSPQNVNKIIDTICKRITAMATRDWRKKVYVHKLGLKTKKCKNCGESLPATEEFFSPDDKARDGFKQICKICR